MNMHDEQLLKAQRAVEEQRGWVQQIAKKRQWYHFMPECGWMNDPNGVIFYKGKYHLFYQFYPYGPYWSAMHWGHAISDDLLHWTYLPVALAPSEPYDDCQKGGVFSGSAVEGKDERLYLFYTGTVVKEDKVIKTQCMAVSEDSINFTKYEGNPVIDATEYTESDPKVWKKDNKWYMVVGGEKDCKGRAILYISDDLMEWTYFGTILESDGSLGAMWECPDIFSLDGLDVLVFGPMHLGEKKCTYLAGHLDYDKKQFVPQYSAEVDYGFDYYAPQSFKDPKGRRIQYAWANAWDWMPWWKGFGTTSKEGWCGAMNIPREVCRKGDQLRFVPVDELRELRENYHDYGSLVVHCDIKNKIIAGDGVHCEVLSKVSLKKTTAEKLLFCVRCADHVQGSNDRHTDIIFDFINKQLIVDRNNSDDWSAGIKKCNLNLDAREELLIHIFMDTVSVEIFTDDYTTAFSANIYPEDQCSEMYVSATGGDVYFTSMETWGMKRVLS